MKTQTTILVAGIAALAFAAHAGGRRFFIRRSPRAVKPKSQPASWPKTKARAPQCASSAR